MTFFITLYSGEHTVFSFAESGDNRAADDSSSLLYAIIFFFPFAISRFLLRKRPISLLEVAYFPAALFL